VASGVLILTGIAGWLRRTRVVKGGNGAAAAVGTRHHRAPRPAGSLWRPPMTCRPRRSKVRMTAAEISIRCESARRLARPGRDGECCAGLRRARAGRRTASWRRTARPVTRTRPVRPHGSFFWRPLSRSVRGQRADAGRTGGAAAVRWRSRRPPGNGSAGGAGGRPAVTGPPR
jgi:hypothetical protein